MNTHQSNFFADKQWMRRSEIYRFLEEICQDLDLTQKQVQKARREHSRVSEWLAQTADDLLLDIVVYSHGSLALGTAIRPLGRDEFDIDLISLVPRGHARLNPDDLKRKIGNRLKEHPDFKNILEEKKRCWRLNYPGDFHMDIAVTIPNPQCVNNGELVPDKKLKEWHPTHPRGFKELFEKRASLEPKFKSSFIALSQRDSAKIEPFPEQAKVKGVLRRLIQLLKRHRDHYFINVKEDIAPISIVITTLAMRSYEHCVNFYTFNDELEMLAEVIRLMPIFIDVEVKNGRKIYAVWNETTEGENFADRWNEQPERVSAFYNWHEKALSDFEAIRDAVGLDNVINGSRQQFGQKITDRVMLRRNEKIADARAKKELLVAPAVGLTTTPVAASVAVPRNDFFGD